MQAQYWLVSLDELIVLIGKHLLAYFPWTRQETEASFYHLYTKFYSVKIKRLRTSQPE